MNHYHFNKNLDDKGRHEVHTEQCSYKPATYNQEYIGYYSNCQEAITGANIKYPYKNFDGCYWCSNPCHKG